MRNDRLPFALLTILVTLAFLALIAKFSIPLVRSLLGPAPTTPALTSALVRSGFNGMLTLYKAHVGHYPASLTELVQRPIDPNDGARWKGPYLADAGVLRDAWGTALLYQAPGTHNPNGYDLWSAGPDRRSGTGDDITNWTAALSPPAPSSMPRSPRP